MTRDLYERAPESPALRVSRRALFGLTRAGTHVDYELATAMVRARDHEAFERAVAPVEAVLAEPAGGELLRLPMTAWRDHDLQALPYADGAFDGVVSAFGAALAPRARRMARELVRVVRPGGIVAIAAWIPKGLPGRLDELLERPEGVRAPSDWGCRDVMAQRLAPLLEGLELRTRTVQLSFPDSEAFAATLATPPELRPHFGRLLASCNNAVEGVEVDARYLFGVGRRPD